MIALLAAVPQETSLIRSHLTAGRSERPFETFEGFLNGVPLRLLHTGIGKAAAASAATVLIERHAPDIIVSIGCGGAYRTSGLAVGDLAVATEEIFGDEGVLAPEGFLDVEALGLPSAQREDKRFYNTFPVSRKVADTVSPLLSAFVAQRGRRVKSGPFVTVSTCSGTTTAGTEMARRTGGICENMEGGAVAQVCALYALPFLEIRGISNLVEDRDTSRWDLKSATEIAQEAVLEILSHLAEA